jgi:hypothetical protein
MAASQGIQNRADPASATRFGPALVRCPARLGGLSAVHLTPESCGDTIRRHEALGRS